MASFKGLKALSPVMMRVDGCAAFITDKVKLGAAPGIGVPVATDTIDFKVGAGSEVCSLEFFMDDLDTGTAFLFGVGYRPVNPSSALTPSSTYFAAAGQTTGQAGGRIECAFKPIVFEEDVYIQIVVGTGPAGITAGNELHMIAGINMNGPK